MKRTSAFETPSSRRNGSQIQRRVRSKKKKQPPIVFVSPSLTHVDLRKWAATAEVRGPIQRGDLQNVESGRLVAIIDGVEGGADRSVTAREIRSAIAEGVRVVGSAGMGARRAAEIEQMLGVGEIYRMYRDGELLRDDEVTVLFDPATGCCLTEPLVNVRFAVTQLVRSGSLVDEHGKAIVKAASQMNYRDRTYDNILRSAGLASKNDAETLARALKAIDLKKEDAITLFERLSDLDADSIWSESAKGKKRVEKGRDPARPHVKKLARADAPLLIWECGESIDFCTLLRFIALTGRLEGYTKNALLRFVLDGGTVPQSKRRARTEHTNAQDLLEEISDSWGWLTSEELQDTLRDLGFGMTDLTERLGEERAARDRVLSLLRRMPPPLLRALRFELLANDLGLKREAMRLGALHILASGAEGDLTEAEIKDAKHALLGAAVHYLRVETWDSLLASAGLREQDATAVVRLLALARRRGVLLLEQLESARATPGIDAAGIRNLPVASYIAGTARSIGDVDALANARKISDAIGITRVAQLSELDQIGGLHVTAAYRSSKTWVGSLASGKGETIDGAVVGAIMEETEKYCQEVFKPKDTIVRAYQDWRPGDAINPVDLYLPYDSSYRPNRPIQWTWATDLVSGRKVYLPLGTLWSQRAESDPYFSERLSRKWFSTNGLASGFTLTEALHHALCERIERHAYKLSEQEQGNPGGLPGFRSQYFHLDLRTCPASTQRICAALKKSGNYEVRVTDITCEVAVPTFYARVFRPSSGRDDAPPVEFYGPGCCTHPNPEVAINRAILEAVQSILVNVSGALEVALNVRSLGRHERPRPFGLAELSRFQPWVPKSSFAANPGFVGSDAREELGFLLQRVTAAAFHRVLYRDLSTEETMPARVVRVIVPGMEDINPVYTGPRARVRAVSDLMRRQEW